MKRHEFKEGESVSAWIDDSCRDGEINAHLMVCNNGWQASGAAMYSIEAVRAAHKSLGCLLAELERTK